MRWGVIVFPGSNCDRDVHWILSGVLGQDVRYLWHGQDYMEDLGPGDWVILPGGFSYGDYLRAGAIARFSPIMQALHRHIENGGYALGICNGFQILCEAGLLPGALLMNENARFICQPQYVRVETQNTPLTALYGVHQVVNMPIAHKEGRYYADADTLRQLEQNGQVLFRYADAAGNVNATTNPNGSLNNIAGIRDAAGKVFGMMPHPERSSDPLLGRSDGLQLFKSIIQWAESHL